MLKRIVSLFLIVLLLALTSCGGDTNTTDTGGGASLTPSTEATEPSHDGTEDERTEQSEAPYESETPSGDTSDEGAITSEDDVDLPKVEF